MQKEIWKPVKGFENRYLISNEGQVYSIVKKSLLKPMKTEKGYLYVDLRCNYKRKPKKIHRLVAETFLENPYAKKEVNHKDGNKLNNTVGNLEWCTRSENLLHAYATGLKAQKIVAVDMFTVDGTFIKQFESIKNAERFTGINRSTISACCRNKANTAGGYVWRYADNNTTNGVSA